MIPLHQSAEMIPTGGRRPSGPRKAPRRRVRRVGRAIEVAAQGGIESLERRLVLSAVTFGPAVYYQAGESPRGVAPADLDGDGRADLAVADGVSDTVSVLLNVGGGKFAKAASYAVGSNPVFVASADLNGDGRADLVTANDGGDSVSVLLNVGGGKFAKAASYAAGLGPESVALADLNGDGRVDLAVASSNSNAVSVLLNIGGGQFAQGTSLATGRAPYSVASADLNGDGRADLATAVEGTGSVDVFLNVGGSKFAKAASYPVGSGPVSVTLADLDGDGRADLVAANSFSNTVSVLLNAGGGTFSKAASYAVGDEPSYVTSADLDGDGRADLAVANANGNTLSVLFNAGAGTFSKADSYATGQGPYAVASADLNGDGRADLATADANYGGSGPGSVGVFLASPTSPITPVAVGNPSFESAAGLDGNVIGVGVWSIPGWVGNAFNPTNASYANASDIGPTAGSLPAPGDGKQVLFINNAGVASQTLSTRLASGTSYTLTVAIGNRGDLVMENYRVSLFAGSTLIASTSGDGEAAPSFGFLDVSASSTAVAASSALVGQPLRIELANLATKGTIQVNFDHVRLTSTPSTPARPIGTPGVAPAVLATRGEAVPVDGALPVGFGEAATIPPGQARATHGPGRAAPPTQIQPSRRWDSARIAVRQAWAEGDATIRRIKGASHP